MTAGGADSFGICAEFIHDLLQVSLCGRKVACMNFESPARSRHYPVWQTGTCGHLAEDGGAFAHFIRLAKTSIKWCLPAGSSPNHVEEGHGGSESLFCFVQLAAGVSGFTTADQHIAFFRGFWIVSEKLSMPTSAAACCLASGWRDRQQPGVAPG